LLKTIFINSVIIWRAIAAGNRRQAKW